MCGKGVAGAEGAKPREGEGGGFNMMAVQTQDERPLDQSLAVGRGRMKTGDERRAKVKSQALVSRGQSGA